MSDKQAPGLSTQEGTGYRRGGGGKRSASTPSTGRMLGMNLMVAILIAGLAVAGWFIANQQQLLIAGQDRLASANDRIERLEQRLMATESALSQGGEETQEQLGFWESEIRKLWAVSNERNRKWMKDNESAIAKVTSAMNGVQATSRDVKAAVDRHEAAFEQQQTLIDQLTSLELQMQQIVRGQRDLVDKVNAASQSVAGLQADLSDKVADNSEAIQSMDAYRVAVNSRLQDIERRLSTALGPAGG